jgi:xanthine dehydrogenase YagR molybdenum-binding subunit
MAKIEWPAADRTSLIGGRITRIDGLEKTTGEAKYTYDINLDNQLIAVALGCPHGHCKIITLDAAPAEKVKGVVHVELLRKAGDEIEWEGELLAVVAAESEGAAREGVAKLRDALKYEELEVFVDDDDLEAAEKAGRTSKAGDKVQIEREPGDDDDEDEFIDEEIARLLKESKHVVEGEYGIDAITHCCLEPHGSTVEWKGDKLNAYLSTQNVSGTDDGFAGALGVTADDVTVTCQYIGGGFGSKFAPDYWGVAAAQIAKKTGRPVKFMLDRDQEQKLGGNRPSGYIKVKLGADADGMVQVWDSHHWGTSGTRGGGVAQSVIPYVYQPKNFRRVATGIGTNTASARAWRAPNHPQGCAITQTAYDDLARVMGANSLEIFKKNLQNIASRQTAKIYAEEMDIAARLMDWQNKWHPHGKGEKNGSVVEGLGLAIHEWGGVANSSTATVRIHPDGGVSTYCGTQELGTGTRTCCAIVTAETLGLEVDDVNVNIGVSSYPISGASGGSTTIGAISESHRRASTAALNQLLAKVAPKLEAQADQLEAVGGRIRVAGNPDRSLSWKEACAAIGMKPIEASASHNRGDASPLSSEGVGGVQMAHVAVDTETGVVRMKKFVCVQDMGLIINRLTAESQCYGAVIMGIAYALFEQRLMDPATGAFVNAELGEYKLPRIGDVGEIVIELYEPEDQRDRGVIGLGEPPVIAPGAAISNAVCNALGVRVPVLPLTPERVLAALEKA